MYKKAWKILEARIQGKTGWGKNDLKMLMLEIIVEVADAMDEGE